MDVDRLIERDVQPSLLSLNCHRLLEHRPGRRKIVLVPKPSTWAMMLAGFAGLAFAGYRRAKADGVILDG
jgi:hypothetical protein